MFGIILVMQIYYIILTSDLYTGILLRNDDLCAVTSATATQLVSCCDDGFHVTPSVDLLLAQFTSHPQGGATGASRHCVRLRRTTAVRQLRE